MEPIRIESQTFIVSEAMANQFSPTTVIVELSERNIKSIKKALDILEENHDFHRIEIFDCYSIEFQDEDGEPMEYEYAGAETLIAYHSGAIEAKMGGKYDGNEWLEVEIRDYLNFEKQ
jgi:hypothetical protein